MTCQNMPVRSVTFLHLWGLFTLFTLPSPLHLAFSPTLTHDPTHSLWPSYQQTFESFEDSANAT